MAQEDNPKKSKLPKQQSGKQTVRERTRTTGTKRPRRLKQTAGKIRAPFVRASSLGKREYHVIPTPDNKFGKVLRKRVRFMPRFFSDAWREIRQVTWPNRRETIRLTMAVFIFALVFAVIVGLLDFGLDKIFKKVIVDNE